MNDDSQQLIRLLKAEIQDLEDQLANGRTPDVQFMDDLDLRRLRRTAMQEALNRTNGNVKEAATLLGIDRSSLSTFIRRYGLTKPRGRDRYEEFLDRMGIGVA